MTSTLLPNDTDALKRLVVRREAELLEARLMVEKLKLELARYKREKFGARSERLPSDARTGCSQAPTPAAIALLRCTASSGTAKLNGLDPQAYLRHVIERIAEHSVNRVDELLPWNVAADIQRSNVHHRLAA